MDSIIKIPKPRSRFLKVKCPGCGNEQTVFDRPAHSVRCAACNQELGKSGASKANWSAKITKVLE
jgi:small subunit ribosomal protein S27e